MKTNKDKGSSNPSFVQAALSVRDFIERWKDHGYEIGECQKFWLELLHDVLGVENPGNIVTFEEQVKLSNTSRIDAYIEPTKVLIEQKSFDKDLCKASKQSDGSILTPFQQAERYVSALPLSKHPRWVVTCNFKSFLIYDMENPRGVPDEILLENLDREYHRLRFLVDDGKTLLQKELEVSIKAGELVGKLYDAFLAQYKGKTTSEDLHSINVLCVRLVFCLYAEDAGVFSKDQFYWYLIQYKPEQMRSALKELFTVLDTKIEDRDRFLDDNLSAFPYVNGSLFHQQPNEDIPKFTQEIADLLLPKASLGFDWSDISPTIFGAVFESTLNPVTRREGGMHYTSIENIHKVIDPLFLNDLKAEFEQIKQERYDNKRKQKLEAFQDKLASLTFLDPACGSGNFLTETYLSLRKLENEVISMIEHGQMFLGYKAFNPIKVNINQFYGIEINDFAVTVAMTALWIAESQMMHETEKIIKFDLDYLPLKSFTNIHHANALRIDWNTLIDGHFDYIMGNPPFVGTKYQNKQQKKDIMELCPNLKPLDYVTAWFYKSSDYIQNTTTKCALVATNSITQGEQVEPLWKLLNFNIRFAHRTFRWDSEAQITAHVHCVIIGFDVLNDGTRIIYEDNSLPKQVERINGYLIPAKDIYVKARKKSLKPSPKMVYGSKPADGGFLLLKPNDKDALIKDSPQIKPYIKLYMGADDVINNEERYCLWLKNCPPSILRSSEIVMKRLDGVKQSRLKSTKPSTRNWSSKPTLFTEDRQPDKDYLIVPVVSSEQRYYLPMKYVSCDVIANANAQMIPECDDYTFGILNSKVHNSWMRAVCGRFETRYAYSSTIVYNTFPWPEPTNTQKIKIEETAKAILNARELYPNNTLADLYDQLAMPPELRKAHEANDRAVMEAYGFDWKTMTEADIVTELFKMYEKLVEAEEANKPVKKTRTRNKKKQSNDVE